jgi:amino acid permease
MASNGVHQAAPPTYSSDQEKIGHDSKSGLEDITSREGNLRTSFSAPAGKDLTQRKLKSRHIQLIGIGGTIGTALYVRTFLLEGIIEDLLSPLRVFYMLRNFVVLR